MSEPRQADFSLVGHHAQHAIADVMAEAVVDALEVVEIDEHHADRSAVALRTGYALLDPVAHQQAIRQVGHCIVRGLVMQALARGNRFADVAQRQDGAFDVAVGRPE